MFSCQPPSSFLQTPPPPLKSPTDTAAATTGPIIRISPHELHISDASFHSTLYVSGATRRTDKWAWHAKQFGTTSTTVGAVEHDVHRTRRAPLARFFAARNFAAGGELERVVSSGVARLGECLADRARRRDGEVVNLSAALAACSADVVGACALGRGFGLLEQEDLGENWWRLMLVCMALILRSLRLSLRQSLNL